MRDVGDVARNTANAQRETMGLARDQARIGEDTLRLRRELQDFQNQMRAERAENTRAAEELSGSKAARRHAPSVPSKPGMSTANRGIYASMVTVRFGSVTSNFPVRMHCSVHKRLLNKRFGSAGSVSKKNDSTGSVPPVYSKKNN